MHYPYDNLGQADADRHGKVDSQTFRPLSFGDLTTTRKPFGHSTEVSRVRKSIVFTLRFIPLNIMSR
jgi:hypothetical protein